MIFVVGKRKYKTALVKCKALEDKLFDTERLLKKTNDENASLLMESENLNQMLNDLAEKRDTAESKIVALEEFNSFQSEKIRRLNEKIDNLEAQTSIVGECEGCIYHKVNPQMCGTCKRNTRAKDKYKSAPAETIATDETAGKTEKA